MKKVNSSRQTDANAAKELQILPKKQTWENAEAVHDELRAAILRNELPAGMILNQVHVAERLGVSRTPLREAFRMLQREGLIEGESNKRMRVAGLSLDGLEDLYGMRISSGGPRHTPNRARALECSDLDARGSAERDGKTRPD